ncbi:phage tail assembly chaperone GT [Oceanobacillus caeni]
MDFMENGKDVNEILDMPFHYVVEILREKNKPEPSGSFFDLLG